MRINFKHPIELIVTKEGNIPLNVKRLPIGSIHQAKGIVKSNGKNYVVLFPSKEYNHKTLDTGTDVMYLCERFMVLEDLKKEILKTKKAKKWNTTSSKLTA